MKLGLLSLFKNHEQTQTHYGTYRANIYLKGFLSEVAMPAPKK